MLKRTGQVSLFCKMMVVMVALMFLFNGKDAFSQPESSRENESQILHQEIKELRQEVKQLREEIVLLREMLGKLIKLAETEISPDLSENTLRLASGNIRVFSDGSRDDDELDYIAKVLIEYDFIAIVELRDETVLKRTQEILKRMGRDYDYLISEPVGRKVKERYAFLFDSQMVDVVDAGKVVSDPNDAFIREPYFATFKAGEFDFTAIAIHVIWGDSVDQRRRELKELANVYQQIQAADDAEQDVILVGDFNRNPGNKSGYGPLLSIPSMGHLFKLPQKSHIKDSSLYDNIFFQTNYVTEYTGDSGIDRFDEIHFNNDDTTALKTVSDHRPVWGTFRIDTDDD